ncbi:MAG: exodeoxyribonuclease V subunit gamma, partial [Burkholderiaceae bacterium]|nr:exodeoxyribonuclease V subunit gamma [Burkholderiaceae bacterium]
MLHLISSNRAEVLLSALHGHLYSRAGSPLVPEQIIVPKVAVEKW